MKIKENFQHFLDIASIQIWTIHYSKNWSKGIYDLTRKSYEPEIDPRKKKKKNPMVSPFATIWLLYGKDSVRLLTCPCLLFSMWPWDIHLECSTYIQFFHSISNAFLKCLMDDVKVLKNKSNLLTLIKFYQMHLISNWKQSVSFGNLSSIQLNSMDLKGEVSGSDWFSYYNKQRNIKCENDC